MMRQMMGGGGMPGMPGMRRGGQKAQQKAKKKPKGGRPGGTPGGKPGSPAGGAQPAGPDGRIRRARCPAGPAASRAGCRAASRVGCRAAAGGNRTFRLPPGPSPGGRRPAAEPAARPARAGAEPPRTAGKKGQVAVRRRRWRTVITLPAEASGRM